MHRSYVGKSKCHQDKCAENAKGGVYTMESKEREELWALPVCRAETMGKPSPGLLTKD